MRARDTRLGSLTSWRPQREALLFPLEYLSAEAGLLTSSAKAFTSTTYFLQDGFGPGVPEEFDCLSDYGVLKYLALRSVHGVSESDASILWRMRFLAGQTFALGAVRWQRACAWRLLQLYSGPHRADHWLLVKATHDFVHVASTDLLCIL